MRLYCWKKKVVIREKNFWIKQFWDKTQNQNCSIPWKVNKKTYKIRCEPRGHTGQEPSWSRKKSHVRRQKYLCKAFATSSKMSPLGEIVLSQMLPSIRRQEVRVTFLRTGHSGTTQMSISSTMAILKPFYLFISLVCACVWRLEDSL